MNSIRSYTDDKKTVPDIPVMDLTGSDDEDQYQAISSTDNEKNYPEVDLTLTDDEEDENKTISSAHDKIYPLTHLDDENMNKLILQPILPTVIKHESTLSKTTDKEKETNHEETMSKTTNEEKHEKTADVEEMKVTVLPEPASCDQQIELYDPNKNVETNTKLSNYNDNCDCNNVNCVGCFFPCEKCTSNKCGFHCRVGRNWIYRILD